MEILKITIYCSIFLLPFGNLLRLPVAQGVNILALDFVMLLNAAFLLVTFRKKAKLLINNTTAPFICFALISILGLVISSFMFLGAWELLVSLFYLTRFFAYLSFWPSLVLTVHSENSLKNLVRSAAFSGFIFTTLGIVQYLFIPNLRSIEFLGWDRHYYRLTSTFFDPNFAGIMILLEIILLMGIFFMKSYFERKLVVFPIFLAFIAFFLTYSRGSYLSAIISIPLFFVFLKKWKMILSFLLIMALGIILVPKNIRSEGVDLFRTASILGRLESYGVGLSIFFKNPVIGIGYNSLRYAQNYYGFLTDQYWRITNAGAGISNSYLLLLATSGVIGTYVFFFSFGKIAKRLMIASMNKDTFAITVLVSIIGVLVHSVTENTFFFPFSMHWIFMMLGFFGSWETIQNKKRLQNLK